MSGKKQHKTTTAIAKTTNDNNTTNHNMTFRSIISFLVVLGVGLIYRNNPATR